MARTIKIEDDLYSELGKFGNRDESWNDVVARVIAHVDEDTAIEDRNSRTTTYDGRNPGSEDSALQKLPDGTTLRKQFSRGEHAGESIEARVEGERVAYGGQTWSPSGAAREADNDLRGDDARGSGYNGWTWWEYENDDGEWVPLDTLTE